MIIHEPHRHSDNQSQVVEYWSLGSKEVEVKKVFAKRDLEEQGLNI
jgi:hypothetical protein